MFSNADIKPRLTSREYEILSLMNNGFSIRQCAKKLGLSHRTIDAHISNAFDHLQLYDDDRHTNKALSLFREFGESLIENKPSWYKEKIDLILQMLDNGCRNFEIMRHCECSQNLVISVKKKYRPELLKNGRITKLNT